jgi:large subunit ribosomal protein L13e
MWSDGGFTIIVQEAGIPIKLASSIGVAVDHRRRNRSLEGLQVILGAQV